MLATLVTMLVYPRTIVYRLRLVRYVTFLVSFIVTHSLVSGLLGLLILLVYVGAIMVIVSYICAVSPNIKYSRSLSVGVICSFVCCLTLLSLTLPSVTCPQPSPERLSPSFLFSDMGVWFVLVLCLFMLIVLIYSTYTSPLRSSLRSTSFK